jgi:hypothetical protein
MRNIENVLNDFVTVCNKYSIPGNFDTVDDLAKLFTASMSKSAELNFFYKNYNPTGLKIETGFTPIKIYSVTDLGKGKIGYEGYPDEFLIIGDDLGGGKPIIAVVDIENTPIYANYDVGEPFKIADNFCDFIVSITRLIDLVYGSYKIFDIADNNDEIKPEFIESLKLNISPIIGKDNFNAFYDYFYG